MVISSCLENDITIYASHARTGKHGKEAIVTNVQLTVKSISFRSLDNKDGVLFGTLIFTSGSDNLF